MTTPASRVTAEKTASRVSNERLAEMIGLGCDQVARHEAYSMARELQSLRSLSSDSVSDESKGVRVKPLQWRKASNGDTREEAKCVLGIYRLALSNVTGKWRWSYNALDYPWSLEFPTYEEAKAAAEADHEQRSLTELQSRRSPSSDGVSEASKRVRVKPLEWIQNTKESVYGENSYTATPIRDLRFVIGKLNTSEAWSYKGRAYGTIEEAKAAAEADYEQSIGSALDSGTGGQQPVAWRWRVIGDSRWTVLDHEPEISDGFRDRCEVQALYPSPTEPKAGVVSEPWTRQDLAEGLALLDGVKLQRIKSSVGPEDDANNWRKYLGDADDLLAHLSICAALNGDKP